MEQIKDSTQTDHRVKLYPTNSDPGRFERLRKEYLYGKGPRSLIIDLNNIWLSFRRVGKRIDDLEDRLKELDGISMPRHIARPPAVTEYHIERFLPDEPE